MLFFVTLPTGDCDKVLFSSAGYDLDLYDDKSSVTCLHKLSDGAFNGEMPCTGLSWSRSGSTLAVSYGRMDHEDWCTHKVQFTLTCLFGLCTYSS